jgi:serine/threonine protein kinase
VCPVDGSLTFDGAEAEIVGGNTDSPEARAPTWAGDSELPGAIVPSITAARSEVLSKAGESAEPLRGSNFGQWDAPEVSERQLGLIGRSIGGRYVIRGELGHGGMGAVYLAEQPSVQRSVAIKILHKEYAENPSIVRRFHQEAMAVSRLNHPNTISVYDFGQSDGLLYIAMEHLKGQTLHAATQAARGLTPSRSLNIMRQVLKSVGEAHRQGIIHRDLKPENIFLTEVDGEVDFVKVLDFGVAKLRQPDEEQATLTQAGSVFGTPRYMAPEQSKDVLLDHRADLYSLGVILYEMLMGRVPFDSDNPLSVLLSHSSQAPPRFSDIRPELTVPEGFEAVVFKALSKDRAQRYQSADDMAVDVERLARHIDEHPEMVVGGQLPRLDRSLSAAGVTVKTDDLAWAVQTSDEAQPRSSGRSGLLWTIALAATAAAIGLWWLSSDRPPLAPRPAQVTEDTPRAGLTPVINSARVSPDAGKVVDAATPRLDPVKATPTPRKPRKTSSKRGSKPRKPVRVNTPKAPNFKTIVVPKTPVIRQTSPNEDDLSSPFEMQ